MNEIERERVRVRERERPENIYNKIFNIIIWTSNLFLFSIGTYFIISNFENLNKSTGIDDCGDIFTMIELTTINSLLIIIGFFGYISYSIRGEEVVSIFTFISSFVLLFYQLCNITVMGQTCVNYYIHNYNIIWIFNIVCIVLLGFNLVLYVIKIINFLCMDTSYRPLINQELVLNRENINADNRLNYSERVPLSPTIDYNNPASENMYDTISNYEN